LTCPISARQGARGHLAVVREHYGTSPLEGLRSTAAVTHPFGLAPGLQRAGERRRAAAEARELRTLRAGLGTAAITLRRKVLTDSDVGNTSATSGASTMATVSFRRAA